MNTELLETQSEAQSEALHPQSPGSFHVLYVNVPLSMQKGRGLSSLEDPTYWLIPFSLSQAVWGSYLTLLSTPTLSSRTEVACQYLKTKE